MHIPDGLLSLPVALACAGLSTAAVATAAHRASVGLSSRTVALLGVTAAFVFVAQMLNFPVAGGTSGHLIGGVLVAVLVGPSMAIIVMTAVLILQCLIFGDGGLLALGANVLNMGVVHPLLGFASYRAIVGSHPPWPPRRIAALAFACYVATIVSAATCAGELALSRVAASAVVLPAMVGAHLVIGMGEALISCLVIATLIRLRPDLLERSGVERMRATSIVTYGLTVSAAVAIFVSPFACAWPDGLERVVERLGVEPAKARIALPAPLRGYAMPGIDGPFGTSMAALSGTLLVFLVCLGIGLALSPRNRRKRDEHGAARASP